MTETTTFEELFDQLKPQFVEAIKQSKLLTSDPIADLRNKSEIRILYDARIQNNKESAFMDFSRGDEHWIKALIEELSRMQYGHPKDADIMIGTATAKRAKGKTTKQTWTEFFEGLHQDKVVKRRDFTESQLRHVTSIIHKLSTDGHKLAGCGLVLFENSKTHELLEP